MWEHVLAVAGLSLACAGWIGVQRFVRARDPEQPGVEGSVGCGGHHDSDGHRCHGSCGSCEAEPLDTAEGRR